MTDQRTTVINTATRPTEAKRSTRPSSQQHTGTATRQETAPLARVTAAPLRGPVEHRVRRRAEAATTRPQRDHRSGWRAAKAETSPSTTATPGAAPAAPLNAHNSTALALLLGDMLMTDQRTTVINTATRQPEAKRSTRPSGQRHTGTATQQETAPLARAATALPHGRPEHRDRCHAELLPTPAAALNAASSTAPASQLGDLR
ncbi:hypothetical protein GCM10010483_48470 [Actinokineospora diospyrosa]